MDDNGILKVKIKQQCFLDSNFLVGTYFYSLILFFGWVLGGQSIGGMMRLAGFPWT